jgi:hypothetical protein
MYIHIDRVLEHISPTDRVLDLGGWERVFPRANVVVDLQPYETRKIVYPDLPEQFNKDTWIQADFCSPAFWRTIPDKAFDFVIISHTLEDIRDPLYVCSEMIRCARGGYIEAPSKFRECAKVNASDPFSGYVHHRWIIEPTKDRSGLVFKAKLAWAHHEDYLGDSRRHLLASYAHHFNGYFWKESFSFIEHFPKGMRFEPKDLRYFYDTFPAQEPEYVFDLTPHSSHPDDGKCLWVDAYRLPSEDAEAPIHTVPEPLHRQ